MVPAMVKKSYVPRIYDESRKRYILVDVLNPKPKSLMFKTIMWWAPQNKLPILAEKTSRFWWVLGIVSYRAYHIKYVHSQQHGDCFPTVFGQQFPRYKNCVSGNWSPFFQSRWPLNRDGQKPFLVFVHPKIPKNPMKKATQVGVCCCIKSPQLLVAEKSPQLFAEKSTNFFIPGSSSHWPSRPSPGSAGSCHRLCAWAAPTSRAWGFALDEASHQALGCCGSCRLKRWRNPDFMVIEWGYSVGIYPLVMTFTVCQIHPFYS